LHISHLKQAKAKFKPSLLCLIWRDIKLKNGNGVKKINKSDEKVQCKIALKLNL
jgi:hypothetical protein